MSRLKLDWSLRTRSERNQFIYTYLDTLSFIPTEEELDMMGKYILWGIDEKTGLNGRQEGLELETAAGTWDTTPVESLDALLESPTFTESMLRAPDMPVFKTPKFKFSRKEARALSTPTLLAQFENLWREIDEAEFVLQTYELQHGRRTKPIRDTLLARLNPEVQVQLTERASHLSQFKYLGLKHQLVDLRRQQYMMRDSYAPPSFSQPTWQSHSEVQLFWSSDIDVRPMGIKSDLKPIAAKIFNANHFPEPSDFTDTELKTLSEFLWRPAPSKPIFDFQRVEDLEKLDQVYNAFYDEDPTSELNSNFNELVEIFEIYCALAPLKPFHRDILNLKRKGISNEAITKIINEKYGHKYAVNYISTLYHKYILGCIAETAKRHREVCENLMFPENFKTCLDCGRTLLRDEMSFMRKSRVKDGFDCRCKQCAKILRDRRNKGEHI